MRSAPASSCKTHCRVREILTNEQGMASGVVYYDKDGVEQFQPAEVVIIACNGVGTPRLLLEFGVEPDFRTGWPIRPAWSART